MLSAKTGSNNGHPAEDEARALLGQSPAPASPTSTPVALSIVVPAHNAADTLEGCLRALTTQQLDEPYEIILVNDGSTDCTAEIAQRFAPHVRVISQPQMGAAAARNTGAFAACGEIVLFTDADCEPVPTWATTLQRALAHGAAGAKGTYRTRQRNIVARFVQAEYESKYRRMEGRDRIDFIDTYSAAYRRDVLVEAGGFDTAYPGATVEDQELSFRLTERGYLLKFAPEAVVYHRHVSTARDYLRRKFRIGYWKVLVAATHPGRIVTDSHTPQSMKMQMLLLGLGALTLPAAPFAKAARRGLGLCAAAFLATTAPFAGWVARKDSAVAAATPAMMLLRAAGLSSGVVAGLGRFGGKLLRRAGYAGAKRALDVGIASAGLLASAPAMALLALAIKLTSRGPVIFVQVRAGRDGKPFHMYKFRTMVNGAEHLRDHLVRERGLEEPVLKFHGDPRVTPVGRFLRRWSLDELPQLLNVLRGEMSLVGPRPEELRVVEMYSPWHRQRLQATPGMTGPAQIQGRADLSLDERVHVELEYIEHPSLIRDARILAHTIRCVIAGDGAY